MSDSLPHTNNAPDDEVGAANELMRLARAIAHHNRRYHAEDAPEISDAEYDALVRRNAELEAAFPHLIRADSPSQAVGHAVTASPLSKVAHEVRMMSLDNAFTDEEVAEFSGRVRRFLALPEDAPLTMTAEDKIDGLSCSLRYEQGRRRLNWAASCSPIRATPRPDRCARRMPASRPSARCASWRMVGAR
ncbi:MAG: hypothetical protein NVS3B27_21620 [Novosphingobium sp.]